jgi:peptidyl-dipeptidase Dcp
MTVRRLAGIAALMSSAAFMTGCTTAGTEGAAQGGAAAAATPAPAATSPLTAPWTGPHGGVPAWDRMRPAEFPAAFTQAMDELRREAAAVRDNPAPATFENTHQRMMMAGQTLSRVYAYWGVQTSNMSNEEVQRLEAEWEPRLSAFFDELRLEPRMFARYRAVYENRERAGLNPQQRRIVERAYEEYVRNGAALDDAGKARLTAINSELAGLYSEFGSRLLADESTYIFITNERELDGLGPPWPMGDQKYPLFGATRAAICDQPGAARTGLAGVHLAR